MESKLVEAQRSTACCNSQNAGPASSNLPPRIRGRDLLFSNKSPLPCRVRGILFCVVERRTDEAIHPELSYCFSVFSTIQ
jgi:hypothetical protein